MSTSQTCATCHYALKKSTFKHCMDCFAKANKKNQFPGWEVKTDIGGKP